MSGTSTAQRSMTPPPVPAYARVVVPPPLPQESPTCAEEVHTDQVTVPVRPCAVPVEPKTPGGMMRRARRAAAVSLEQLAQVTRIPLASLEALEADRYEDLPGRAYARGFYRSVAAELRADPEPWLLAFDHELPELDEPGAGADTGSWLNSSIVARPLNIPVRLGHVLAVLLGILTFFLLYFALEGGSASGDTTASSQDGALIEMLDKRPVQRR